MIKPLTSATLSPAHFCRMFRVEALLVRLVVMQDDHLSIVIDKLSTGAVVNIIAAITSAITVDLQRGLTLFCI